MGTLGWRCLMLRALWCGCRVVDALLPFWSRTLSVAPLALVDLGPGEARVSEKTFASVDLGSCEARAHGLRFVCDVPC